MFLEMIWEDKRLWAAWQPAFPEFNLLLISTRMEFWFLTLVTKYLNIATFSNYLSAVSKMWHCPTFWWRDITIYLVSPEFTYRSDFLLDSKRASVLLDDIHVFTQYINVVSARAHTHTKSHHGPDDGVRDGPWYVNNF